MFCVWRGLWPILVILESDDIFWDYEGLKFEKFKIGYLRSLGLNIEIHDWLETYGNYVIIFIGDDL